MTEQKTDDLMSLTWSGQIYDFLNCPLWVCTLNLNGSLFCCRFAIYFFITFFWADWWRWLWSSFFVSHMFFCLKFQINLFIWFWNGYLWSLFCQAIDFCWEHFHLPKHKIKEAEVCPICMAELHYWTVSLVFSNIFSLYLRIYNAWRWMS